MDVRPFIIKVIPKEELTGLGVMFCVDGDVRDRTGVSTNG